VSETNEMELTEALERLRRLEDDRDIRDCLHAYSDGLDGKHLEDFLDCFTEDGRFAWKPTPDVDWALEVEGRAALEAWYHDHEQHIPAGLEHHVLTNPRVVANEGDRARAVSWYLIIRDYGGRPGVRSTGRYLDQLVRGSDGRWRIRERLALGDMPRVPR
jgi:3-phenylpropionate/cinnamic acid dioxygenase small subunit